MSGTAGACSARISTVSREPTQACTDTCTLSLGKKVHMWGKSKRHSIASRAREDQTRRVRVYVKTTAIHIVERSKMAHCNVTEEDQGEGEEQERWIQEGRLHYRCRERP
eukprot:1092877-Prymnesium_polylepis.1